LFFSLNLSRKEQTMPALNEIYARVTKVLVHALGVEEGDIKPFATLQGDPGTESIDFLDITFRLEREFGIKIPRGELFPEPASRDAPAFTRDGRPTDEGLAALRLRMPYADLRELERDRRLNRIDDLFTVDLVASYIRWRLGGSGAAETDAHAPAFHHSPEDLTLAAISTGS
jgi:acyl carrier protein